MCVVPHSGARWTWSACHRVTAVIASSRGGAVIGIALLGPMVPLVMLLGLPALEDRLFPSSLPPAERGERGQAEGE